MTIIADVSSVVITVGLIADTHSLLRPEALEALGSVDLIVHAGDAGREDILETLEQLAPVYAVRGNVDRGAWAEALPISRRVVVSEVSLYVFHGHEKLLLTLPRVAARSSSTVIRTKPRHKRATVSFISTLAVPDHGGSNYPSR